MSDYWTNPYAATKRENTTTNPIFSSNSSFGSGMNVYHTGPYAENPLSMSSKRPDDLAVKGMMAKLSSAPPASTTGATIKEPPRINLASSSPTRSQARAILFPEDKHMKATNEKAKFLPPKHSLASLSTVPQRDTLTNQSQRPGQFSYLEPKPLEENDDDFWTTIFGFPPGEVENVIAYFKRLGTIEEIRKVDSARMADSGNLPAGPTWIHIRWEDRIDAEKALRKEGTILRSFTENCMDQNHVNAMDYMLGVMNYRKAKKVLSSENETIYWQSPIRKTKVRETLLADQRQNASLFKPTDNLFSKAQPTQQSLLDKVLEYLF